MTEIHGLEVRLDEFDVEGSFALDGQVLGAFYGIKTGKRSSIKGLLIQCPDVDERFKMLMLQSPDLSDKKLLIFAIDRHVGHSILEAERYPIWVNSWVVDEVIDERSDKIVQVGEGFPMSRISVKA